MRIILEEVDSFKGGFMKSICEEIYGDNGSVKLMDGEREKFLSKELIMVL
jgi:hypothetical protein